MRNWRIAKQVSDDDRVWPWIENLNEPYYCMGIRGFRNVVHVSGSTLEDKQTLAEFIVTAVNAHEALTQRVAALEGK